MATINKRGSSWQVRYDAGNDPITGKRIQKSKTFKRKKDAENFLIDIQKALKDNTYVEENKITTGAYMLKWLEDYAKPNYADTTVAGYERNIKNHMIPAIGAIPLQKLKTFHIQEFYKDMQKKGYSAKTIIQIHRILNQALTQADAIGLIFKNPATAVLLPKPEKFEATTLDQTQVMYMLKTLKKNDSELYIPVLLAVMLGLRRGEVLGLRWQDVVFEQKQILIRNNRTYDGKNIVNTTPKSETSRRILSMTSFLETELKWHKEKQEELKARLGNQYSGFDFVCTRENGTLFHPGTLSKIFAKEIYKMDLPKLRFHDLRHTNATIMLKNNVPAKVASERLGHSTVAITLDLYSHVTNDLELEAAEAIEKSILKSENKTHVNKT